MTGKVAAHQSGAGSSEPANLLVLLAAPRGFCAGVRRAIDSVREALRRHGAPVYVRRPIVHNLAVLRMLKAEGAIFVQELAEVPEHGIVVLSAHGVAPRIVEEANARRLIVYDAACPLVTKVHREVVRHHKAGRHVFLIGHEAHPEVEGTMGHLPQGGATVIGDERNIDELELGRSDPVAFAVQTTFSVDESAGIIAALHARFDDLASPVSTDICYATTNRQAAVKSVAAEADAVIVAGEDFSSNANRLVETARRLCPLAQLVAQPEEIDWSQLPRSGTVGLTAAASTPEETVTAILNALGRRYRVQLREIPAVEESIAFKRVAIG